jgi:hypothetical protein
MILLPAMHLHMQRVRTMMLSEVDSCKVRFLGQKLYKLFKLFFLTDSRLLWREMSKSNIHEAGSAPHSSMAKRYAHFDRLASRDSQTSYSPQVSSGGGGGGSSCKNF